MFPWAASEEGPLGRNEGLSRIHKRPLCNKTYQKRCDAVVVRYPEHQSADLRHLPGGRSSCGRWALSPPCCLDTLFYTIMQEDGLRACKTGLRGQQQFVPGLAAVRPSRVVL